MRTRYIITIAICVFLASLSITSGGSLMLQADSGGNTSTVTVQLDPEDETLNAVEGTISYPPNLLSLERIQTGDSVISMWVEEPSRVKSGTVKFSGVIIGGFDGVLSSQYDGTKPGRVMKMHFSHKSNQSAVVTTKDIKGYLHDGEGTQITLNPASVILSGIMDDQTVTLSDAERAQEQEDKQADTREDSQEDDVGQGRDADASDPETEDSSGTPTQDTQSTTTTQQDESTGTDSQDTRPPFQLSADIVKSEYLYDGRYALAFNARDAASGIAYYEVKESPQSYSIASLYQSSSWRKAESPELLADQQLKSNILIKAVDKAGNERIAKIPAQNPVPWYQNYIILSLLLLILIVVGRFLFARSSKESISTDH